MTTEEKIKNGIEELIKDAIPEGSSIAPGTNITKEEALKWLEEQGKHGDSLNEAYLELEVAKDADLEREAEKYFHSGQE